eukprot:1853-Heterococcus_DN1.PRE.1
MGCVLTLSRYCACFEQYYCLRSTILCTQQLITAYTALYYARNNCDYSAEVSQVAVGHILICTVVVRNMQLVVQFSMQRPPEHGAKATQLSLKVQRDLT